MANRYSGLMMNCRNCQEPLVQGRKFCAACGAKHIHNRLTLKGAWGEFIANFLNLENSLFKTFIHLFTRPEAVAGGFIEGVRKKYVNPFNYYALALTLVGLQFFIIQKFFPEALDVTSLLPENTPQSDTDFSWIFDYYSILALINVPIYALIGKLTFLGLKKFNYTEHLVIMVYLVAQFSIINFVVLTTSAASGINYYIAGSIMNLWFMMYTAYSYKRLYPLSWKGIIGRCIVFLFIVIFLVLLSGILQVVYYIYTGEFQEMIEEARKAREATSYIVSSSMNWTS